MGRRMLARSTMILREGRKNHKQRWNHMTCHDDELIHGVPKDHHQENSSSKDEAKCTAESALWVPHPRTGIYYPRGHEWVMEDVPQGASSFPQPFWLRSGEVVERPASTTSKSASSHCSDDEVFDHPFLNL